MFLTYLFYGALIALLIYVLYQAANRKTSPKSPPESSTDQFIKDAFDKAISEPDEEIQQEPKKRSPNISISVEFPTVD